MSNLEARHKTIQISSKAGHLTAGAAGLTCTRRALD